MTRLVAAAEVQAVRREARAVAAAVDLLVVGAIGVVCGSAALLAMMLQVNPFERVPTGGEWAVGYAVFLLWLPAAGVYAGLGSRTVGSRLLRLELQGASPRRAVVRGLMWWPSLLLGAGLWWSWIDPRGRSLSDVVSGTVLVESTRAGQSVSGASEA